MTEQSKVCDDAMGELGAVFRRAVERAEYREGYQTGHGRELVQMAIRQAQDEFEAGGKVQPRFWLVAAGHSVVLDAAELYDMPRGKQALSACIHRLCDAGMYHTVIMTTEAFIREFRDDDEGAEKAFDDAVAANGGTLQGLPAVTESILLSMEDEGGASKCYRLRIHHYGHRRRLGPPELYHDASDHNLESRGLFAGYFGRPS